MTTRKIKTEATTYILTLFLPRARRIKVGRLGYIMFEPGLYLYVGSAGASPARRIARHARRRKSKFWHIDFLSAHAKVIGALIFEAPTSLECPIAKSLAGVFTIVPRFGSSDCACASHLFRVPTDMNPIE